MRHLFSQGLNDRRQVLLYSAGSTQLFRVRFFFRDRPFIKNVLFYSAISRSSRLQKYQLSVIQSLTENPQTVLLTFLEECKCLSKSIFWERNLITDPLCLRLHVWSRDRSVLPHVLTCFHLSIHNNMFFLPFRVFN